MANIPNTIYLTAGSTTYTAGVASAITGAKTTDSTSDVTVYGTSATDNINLSTQTAQTTNVIIGNGGGDNIKGSTVSGATETITAGKGGNVTLNGAKDTVIYNPTDGTETISGFNPANAKISINANASQLTFSDDGSDATITLDTNDKVVVKGVTALNGLNGGIKTADGVSNFLFANAGTIDPGSAAAAANAYEVGSATNDNITYYGTEKFVDGLGGTNTLTVGTASGLTVDLSDTTKFKNIQDVVGGAGNDILRGNSSGNVVLTGTGGNDQFWGHGGNNTTMTGSAGNDTFYFGSGDQNDTVDGGTGNDVVDLYNVNASDLKYTLDTTTGNLKVNINGDSADSLTITDPTDNFTFKTKDNQSGFKVLTGNNTYSPAANTYVGTGTSSITTDGSGDTINLYDTTKYQGYTEVVATPGAANDIVRGTGTSSVLLNEQNNTGNAQLWGGNGGNDTLVGSTGNDSFYFGSGNGQDTVQLGAGSTDTIKLYNVNASNVKYSYTAGGNLTATIKGDSTDKLTITNPTVAHSLTVATADNTAGSGLAVVDATGNVKFNNATGYYVGATNGSSLLSTDGNGDTINLYDTTKYQNITKVKSTTGGNDILRGIGGTAQVTLDGSANGTSVQLWGGNGGNDTLKGGTGADTYYFGNGNGQDTIAQQAGAKDVVNLYNVNASDLVFGKATNDLTVQIAGDSTDKLTIQGWFAAGNDVANTTIVTKDNKNGFKLSYDAAGALLPYQAGTYYVGVGASTIDGSAQTSNLTINLYDTTQYDASNPTNRIVKAQGGAGNDVLRGIAGLGTTLMGGAGSDQLWAENGAVNSTLDGGTGDHAADTYFYGKQGGTVGIQNYGKEDTVKLYNANASDLKFSVNTGDLVVNFAGDNTDTLKVIGYEGNASTPTFVTADNATGFKVVEGNAATGALTYDSAANYYLNNTATATAANGTIDATAQTSGVLVDLSDSKKYQALAGAGAIDTITGGAGSDTLRGNADANSITAGNGGAQLWGGIGGYGTTDTLVGGAGADTFWFGSDGAKEDIVKNSDAYDKVFLYSSAFNTSNATITNNGGNLDITFGGNYTVEITGDAGLTKANTFVFGRTATSDNTYKITQTAGVYSFTKA